MTPAKKLHDLIEKIAQDPGFDKELAGQAIAKIEKIILGKKDGGAALVSQITSLLEQIEDGVRSIPNIKGYHQSTYLDAVSRIRGIVSPAYMASNWDVVKKTLNIANLLSSLVMMDHALENARLYSISRSELEEIAGELSELGAYIDGAEVPEHVKRMLVLEIEKLKILVRSEDVFDKQKFMRTYEALSAKILAMSELFANDKEGIKNRVLRMLARVRESVGLSADTAQLADAATKLLS